MASIVALVAALARRVSTAADNPVPDNGPLAQLRGAPARAYAVLLETTMASTLKAGAFDVTADMADTALARVLLAMRAPPLMKYDRADRAEALAIWCLETHDNAQWSNDTMRAMVLLLAECAQPGHDHGTTQSNQSTTTVLAAWSDPLGASLSTIQGESADSSGSSSQHTLTVAVVNATDDGLVEHSVLRANPRYAAATVAGGSSDPWRIVYSDASFRGPGSLAPMTTTTSELIHSGSPWDLGLTWRPGAAHLMRPGAPLLEGHSPFAAPAEGQLLDIPRLGDTGPTSIMDWVSVPSALDSTPAYSFSQPSATAGTSSSMSSSRRPPRPPTIAAVGQLFSRLENWDELDATQSWELAIPGRSLSAITQPAVDVSIGQLPPAPPTSLSRLASPLHGSHQLQQDKKLSRRRVLDPTFAGQRHLTPLLSWDHSVPRRPTNIGTPAVLPAPPMGGTAIVSPFLSEASEQVQQAVVDRAYRSGAAAADGLMDEDLLVRHTLLLVCGIENATFAWVHRATEPRQQPPSTWTGFRMRNPDRPVRTARLSHGAVMGMIDRFLMVGSTLRRLELAANDLRDRVREHGFVVAAVAAAIDEIVDEFRHAALNARPDDGHGNTVRPPLRALHRQLGSVATALSQLAMMLGSSPTHLHRISVTGLDFLNILSREVAAATSVGSPSFSVEQSSDLPTLGALPESSDLYASWVQLIFQRCLAPALRWIRQLVATVDDPRTLGSTWNAIDPHREFPVVWTGPGPTVADQTSAFWASEFQLLEPGKEAESLLMANSDLQRLVDLQKALSLLPPDPVPALTAWAATLLWPETSEAAAALDDNSVWHAHHVHAVLSQSASAIEQARAAAQARAQQLGATAADTHAAQIASWHARRTSVRAAADRRKRALMAELRGLDAARIARVAAVRRREVADDVARLRAELARQGRWDRTVEQEKHRLLDQYEARIQAVRRETDQISGRRRAMAVRRARERADRAGVLPGLPALFTPAPTSPLPSHDGPVEMEAMVITEPEPVAVSPSVEDQGLSGVFNQDTTLDLLPLAQDAMSDDHVTEMEAPSPPPQQPLPAPLPVPTVTDQGQEELSTTWIGSSLPGLLLSSKHPLSDAMLAAQEQLLPTAARPVSATNTSDKTKSSRSPSTVTRLGDTSGSSSSSSSSGSSSRSSLAVSGPTIAQDEDEQNDEKRLAPATPLPFSFATVTFHRYLKDNLALAEYAVLATILACPTLSQDLHRLHDYFFVHEPQFAERISQSLIHFVGAPIAPGRDLNSDMVRVLDGVSRVGFATPGAHQLSSEPYDPRFYDFVTLTFQTTRPLWSIITTPLIAQCNRIFRLRVQLIYLHEATKSLFVTERQIAQLPIPLSQLPTTIEPTLSAIHILMDGIDARLGRFRVEAQHFSAALSGYVSDSAIAEPWHELAVAIEDARDQVLEMAGRSDGDDEVPVCDVRALAAATPKFRSLRGLHDHVYRTVSAIQFRAFLHPQQQQIADTLASQLRAVLVVEHLAREYLGLREKYVRDQIEHATATRLPAVRFGSAVLPGLDGLRRQLIEVRARMDECAAEFARNARVTVRVLTAVAERSGGTYYMSSERQGQEAQSVLVDLLVRLDFNRHYAAAASV
ncbi:hypothetical protein BC828DRAFT_186170 [Blastocladiella britannica]|nr:hypothetical protein BC828DRAFT_186170 [Blastocladiella britannica]